MFLPQCQKKTWMLYLKGFNRPTLIFCLFLQDTEKMEMLRAAIAAQTKYTILVICSNPVYFSCNIESVCTYAFCHFSGYNRDGNRQSLTGITWNCTGAKDGEARNVQRRGLSHQYPVHSFHKSGIVINKLKLPFWKKAGSLVPYDLADSLIHSICLSHSALRFLHLLICSAATDLYFQTDTERVIILSPITSSFPCPASTTARRPARQNSSSHWRGDFWTCRICVKNTTLS